MKHLYYILFCTIVLTSCKSTKVNDSAKTGDDLIIAFGSCNKQNVDNLLWDDVLNHQPKAWIWGGDNIYSDTNDMAKMKQDYNTQIKQEGYIKLIKNVKVLGTWDDHDYGINDGGEEFTAKSESQQLFLDFLSVPKDDARRDREGVYYSDVIYTTKGSVKVIVLDTRFFRSGLTTSTIKGRRYDANTYGDGTMLGKTQWQWLKSELQNSKADFNLIVSSIQVISEEHGFEKWANMPHQRDHLINLITNSKANNVIILSGDRHISEFSKLTPKSIAYPLIDFTSSGLTHSYSNFKSEPNKHRVGDVVASISFGLLKFNFKSKKVTMQMRGENDVLQQELIQRY